MTDREKLIELLNRAIVERNDICAKASSCTECEEYHPDCVIGITADYLLSNGMTVAKDTNVLGNIKNHRARSTMPDKDLIAEVRSSALAHEFADRNIILELCRRYENRCNHGAWILVTERLPEEHQPVLFCRKGGNVDAGCRIESGWWKSYGIKVKSVTHWMPLPEPPKED